MRFQSILASFLAANVACVLGRPVWSSRNVPQRRAIERRAFVPTTDYSAFQISSTVAGNAEAEANAVFSDPFDGTDLSTISDDTVDALNVMRELAEDAETKLFNPQIAAASGATADALSVGKIKNKVLKLTGEVQVIKIKIAKAEAAGDDTSDLEDDLTAEQAKLTKNIATDVKNKGKTSQAPTGTVTPRK